MGTTKDSGKRSWQSSSSTRSSTTRTSCREHVSGDVALNGTVPSYPQYLEAAAAAQRVGGVKDVHNHLQVVLPARDYRDDAMLTTAANNALALNVTVPDGVEASARGRQPDADRHGGLRPERAAAERAVSGLIRPAATSGTTSRSATTSDPVDVDLHRPEALAAPRWFPTTATSRHHQGGIITLTGHVRTWAEHDAVIDAAWMARRRPRRSRRASDHRLTPPIYGQLAAGMARKGRG
jgi:hypothetical protein